MTDEPSRYGTSLIERLNERSLRNLREPVRIVLGRFANRAALYPKIPWRGWSLACLMLAGVCLVFLDDVAGRHRGQWPSNFGAVADIVTKLGLGKWYIVPAAIWLLFVNLTEWRDLSRRRLAMVYNRTCLAFFVLISAGFSGLAVLFLKSAIGRARPLNYEEFGILSLHPFMLDARFASFPSGHATVIGAVAAVLLLLFPKWKYAVPAFAVSVASTRIFVGAHYPSDAVVGFGLGFGCAIVTAVVFARLGFIFMQAPYGLPVRKKTFRLGRARPVTPPAVSKAANAQGQEAAQLRMS